MDALEELRLNRLARENNLSKGMNTGVEDDDIVKAFGGDDFLEKGKWNVGDEKIYQGITYFVSGFNAKGVPLWKKKKDGQGGDAVPSEKKEDNSSADKEKFVIDYDLAISTAEKNIEKYRKMRRDLDASIQEMKKKQAYASRTGQDFSAKIKSEEEQRDLFLKKIEENQATIKALKEKKQAAEESGSKKEDSLDIDYTLNKQEYDRITAQAKKADRFSREYAIGSAAQYLKEAVKELNDAKKNRPGAKKTIATLQEKVDALSSRFKAMKDYEERIKTNPEERDFDAELKSLREMRDFVKKEEDKIFDHYITTSSIAKRTGDASDIRVAENAEKRWNEQYKLRNKYQDEIKEVVKLKEDIAKKSSEKKEYDREFKSAMELANIFWALGSKEEFQDYVTAAKKAYSEETDSDKKEELENKIAKYTVKIKAIDDAVKERMKNSINRTVEQLDDEIDSISYFPGRRFDPKNPIYQKEIDRLTAIRDAKEEKSGEKEKSIAAAKKFPAGSAARKFLEERGTYKLLEKKASNISEWEDGKESVDEFRLSITWPGNKMPDSFKVYVKKRKDGEYYLNISDFTRHSDVEIKSKEMNSDILKNAIGKFIYNNEKNN